MRTRSTARRRSASRARAERRRRPIAANPGATSRVRPWAGRAGPRGPRENRRSAPGRLVFLLEKKEPRPLTQWEAVARNVERPGHGHAERAQRVEAREDEGRNGVGPAREDPGSAPLSNPFRGEPDRRRARRTGDGNRRDGAARAVPVGEVAGERTRVAPGESAGSARPLREPLREGTISGERRPDGDSRAAAAEVRTRRERLDRGVAGEQRLQLRAVRSALAVDQGRLPRVKSPGVEPCDRADRRQAEERALPERGNAVAKTRLGGDFCCWGP